MLGIGMTVSRDIQLLITVLTITVMVGALIPKFWRRKRAPHARR
jgi:hypothetical protein